MTEEEQEYLESQLPVLRDQMADCSNRIEILKAKRSDLNKRLKGFRARLERAKMDKVSDW